jgi:hypothetical protein
MDLSGAPVQPADCIGPPAPKDGAPQDDKRSESCLQTGCGESILAQNDTAVACIKTRMVEYCGDRRFNQRTYGPWVDCGRKCRNRECRERTPLLRASGEDKINRLGPGAIRHPAG